MDLFKEEKVNLFRIILFVSGISIISQSLTAEEPVGATYKDIKITEDVQLREAAGIIARILPEHKDNFIIEIIPKENMRDVFELESKNSKIILRGSSGVAIASALNYYLKNFCNCHISYCGNQLKLPETLPKIEKKIKVNNLYKYRVYYNYCTLSYTAPWWDWKRWEQEIDFQALNGINMPLSVIGLEGVWYNTLLKFGYNDADARKFLVGPAYFAWQWMTNIQSHGGPLPKKWIISHIKLGQKIIERQRALGMTPIQQGFSGSMPMDFKGRFPEAEISPGHKWCKFSTVPGQLNPLDPMFKKFGKVFLREEQRLFGTSHIYAADPFHEGTPPRKDEEYLTKVGKAINNLLVDVDPDAKCAMQSWSIRKPIACAFPKDRLIVLDLAGYKDAGTQNFWGYEYVKGQLHNFGGRINMHGDLEDVANNRFAKAAKEISNCVGLGLFMEGMVQNPVFYDIVFDQFWSNGPVDVKSWLKKYARRRYGVQSDSADQAWMILLETAYTHGTSGVEKSSIVAARPALNCKKSGPNAGFKTPYKHVRLLEALKLLLKDHKKLQSSDAYVYDVVDLTRQILSNLGQELHKETALAFIRKDKEAFAKNTARFLNLLKDIDTLLATRPEFSYGKWIADARSWGDTPEEKAYYEWNAGMLVTIWGPENKPRIFDYSWREWSGLIKEYYLPRWKKFYDLLKKKLDAGEDYQDPKKQTFGRESLRANDFYSTLADWEIAWSRKHHELSPEPKGNGIDVSIAMLKKYQPVINKIYSDSAEKSRKEEWQKYLKGLKAKSFAKKNGKVCGDWNSESIASTNGMLKINISKFIPDEGTYDITFIPAPDSSPVEIQSVTLLQEGVKTAVASEEKNKKHKRYSFNIDAIAFGAKYELMITLKSSGDKPSGKIYIKKR
jgi:alpha-N-acetylglucosaminidase